MALVATRKKTGRRNMDTIQNNIRFSIDSLEARDELRDLFFDILRSMAIERAMQEGRHIVTEEDFFECFDDAIQLATSEFRDRRSN